MLREVGNEELAGAGPRVRVSDDLADIWSGRGI